MNHYENCSPFRRLTRGGFTFIMGVSQQKGRNNMQYITGGTIRKLREQKHLTQKQLAATLNVSDKTISKWETGRGLPDISILMELAAALGVSVPELLTGEYAVNSNRSSNIRKMRFYVCPVCGNVVQSIGEGAYSCCGVSLPPLEAEECTEEHGLHIEESDGDYYITMDHPMEKSHYISFFCYVNAERTEFVKLYPEQNAAARIQKRKRGYLYAYCNRHGLFRVML